MKRRLRWPRLALLALTVGASLVRPVNAAAMRDEPIDAAVCRLIETSARSHDLPVGFLTRLIWQESSFRPDVTSPAGAQGIAQIMPGTAQDRGVADPFDPEEAIPKAADFLAELSRRFGNLGLAAAAYNGGPTRVANWLSGHGGLPAETRDYVFIITGHSVEDWASKTPPAIAAPAGPAETCLQLAANIRRLEPNQFAGSVLLAPWGVQLAGSFSKGAALADYARARSRYAALLGKIEPMIIGGRLLSRGFRPFYRIRAPAPSRAAANALCNKITRLGGACAVLRSIT